VKEALCRELLVEYLAVKKQILAGRKQIEDMTARGDSAARRACSTPLSRSAAALRRGNAGTAAFSGAARPTLRGHEAPGWIASTTRPTAPTAAPRPLRRGPSRPPKGRGGQRGRARDLRQLPIAEAPRVERHGGMARRWLVAVGLRRRSGLLARRHREQAQAGAGASSLSFVHGRKLAAHQAGTETAAAPGCGRARVSGLGAPAFTAGACIGSSPCLRS